MKHERGFTLLEMMVAMAIFAMLALAGWQVFDGVNRARERAQYHADQLAVLQYAYLQLQQDMGQIIAYQAPALPANGGQTTTPSENSSATNASTNTPAPDTQPFMQLNKEQVSFVRFADPDPRYQSSPSIQRVAYVFAGERLIRRQYLQLQGTGEEVSLDSVVLEGVSDGRWQAYLPEVSDTFPNDASSTATVPNNSVATPNAPNALQPQTALLPKGVAVSFTYQDTPITWQWALATNTPPINDPVKTGSNDE